MKNKPNYAIESVDHALQLAQFLQQEGTLRVTDAAERLGVSRSTAHRLLAMLVYRDFAVQGEDRRYRSGPVLRPTAISHEPITLLRNAGTPELRDLVARVRETANIQIRAGREVRFVASVECDQVLRVGDRTGRVLRAHEAAGGQVLLATLDDDALNTLYDGELDVARLRKRLHLVRKRGFAVNDQETEAGVVAIGMIIAPHRHPLAAVALAVPSIRYTRDRLPRLCEELERTASRITLALESRLDS